ncbi:hypothetical protein LIN78_01480 [Leeia sp. TBRC 13508]|uniref:Secreted protein n=1 Tax=Leeia speluncae TaxID=2884804 RepID=A0ABS8D212_9NEIS|nr:hypothetical protein [Leeia speluncae]MCB6182227.1 hypothetical protein [Leeia speluncae]
MRSGLLQSLAIFFTLAVCLTLSARDLPKSDPDRKAILDAIRSEPDEKIVVKDLFRAGDFAWTCTLKTTDTGEYYRTDESIEVYFSVLLKQNGKWLNQSVGGSFTESAAKVDCSWPQGKIASGNAIPQSQENIQSIWKKTLQAEWLDGLHWGKLPKMTAEMQSLAKYGLIEDISAETPKEGLDHTQISIMLDRCKKNSSCITQTKQAIQQLAILQKDKSVSSVIWNNCNYGLRLFNPILIAQCVSKQSTRPECKPGQMVLKHQTTLSQCIDGIHKQCKEDVRDAQTSKLACSW